MPRIIITNDASRRDDAVVVLDEQLQVAELSEDHGGLRFIERLGWAISDAEDPKTAQGAHSRSSSSSPTVPRWRSRRPERSSTSTRRRNRSAVASLLPRATT